MGKGTPGKCRFEAGIQAEVLNRTKKTHTLYKGYDSPVEDLIAPNICALII